MKSITIRILLMVFASIALSAFALTAGALYDSYHILKAANSQADRAEKIIAKKEAYDLAADLRKKSVNALIEENSIKAYSYNQVLSMDMSKPSGVTKDELKMVTKGNLVGLEDAFYKSEHENNINCLFVLGIASHESAYGKSCFRPNNLFGYGTKGFKTKSDCVETVAHALGTNYMNGGKYSSGSSNTIDSVNKRYAADPAWDKKVAKKVTGFYGTIAAARTKQLKKLQ